MSHATPGASLAPTSQHTIGPFFPRTFFQPGDNDLTITAHGAPPTRRGETVLLRGRVTRADNLPCVNQILEAWQADAAGRFNHPLDPERHLADPDFLGWGRTWTDANGRYEFRTVIPGAYVEAGVHRAPHVNLTVMGAGLMRRVQTTMFFPGFEAENAVDPVLSLVPEGRRPRLVAIPDGRADGLRAFRFDIRLRGDGDEETPFFEE
jgi:protocatechuate 3,4-dioxygenase alpha subunit